MIHAARDLLLLGLAVNLRFQRRDFPRVHCFERVRPTPRLAAVVVFEPPGLLSGLGFLHLDDLAFSYLRFGDRRHALFLEQRGRLERLGAFVAA
jgi:hypothetical protein